MVERGVLLNAGEVRATLDGRKTQLRRPLKTQPPGHVSRLRQSHSRAYEWIDVDGSDFGALPPYGVPGDLLWVRETFRFGEEWDNFASLDVAQGSAMWAEADGQCSVGRYGWGKLRPSTHMPRWVVRLWLRVVGVRVERLQGISEDDAEAEGCVSSVEYERQWPSGEIVDYTGLYAVDRFVALWDFTNAKGSFNWDANPWVWVITFERCEAPAVE